MEHSQVLILERFPGVARKLVMLVTLMVIFKQSPLAEHFHLKKCLKDAWLFTSPFWLNSVCDKAKARSRIKFFFI